ncbi:MAG: polyamine aminopropyltransferase, partial [Sulfuricella sp.]|nr:polyamine aminopropyltransferase [Sulfuricella sp.]
MNDDRLSENLNADSGWFTRAGRCLEKRRSRYQDIEVWDTPEFGRLFRLDGCFMSSERDEFFYHENIVHLPAIAHPAPRRALVVGGGDGGSAEELLKHPSIEKVVIAELDEEVVNISRTWLQAVHHGALDHPKVEIRIGDGLAYVRDSTEVFDLIILDLTDPGGPATPLYSAEFYAACRTHLAPGGALALHIGSP